MDFLIGAMAGVLVTTMIAVIYASKLKSAYKQEEHHRQHVFGILLVSANRVAQRKYVEAKEYIDIALSYKHYELTPRHKQLAVLLQSKVDLLKCKEL